LRAFSAASFRESRLPCSQIAGNLQANGFVHYIGHKLRAAEDVHNIDLLANI